MCREGFRKEKKSQGSCLQLYTSAYTCSLAKNQVRTELDPSRPELRTNHGLNLWRTATKTQSRTAPQQRPLPPCVPKF